MSRVANLHAHIFTPAGVETGVVNMIQEWSLDDVMDGAGKWAFECWAKKSNVDLLVAGRRVDVYGTPAGSEILLSSGSLDGKNPDVNKLSGSTFPVSGMTRIGELSDRTIVALSIVEQEWMAIGANGSVRNIWMSYWEVEQHTHWWERDMVELYDGNPATWYGVVLSEVQSGWINYLYAGFDSLFDAIRATIHIANTYPGAHICIQYNGPSGWAGVADIVDGTIAGGTTMAQTGVISWTRPTDWIRSTVTALSGSWYWIRMYVDVEWTSDLEITEIEVYADKPTLNGLNLIMAYAPSGWKTSGYANTASTAYGEVKDMTVLAALRWLRDQIGGHFVASLVGGVMQVDWIDTFTDSGYTADGAATP